MDLRDVMELQDGVVSRRQVLELGATDNDVARWIRRREWSRLFEGVYVDHTGPPSWRQRAWGAVLVHAPAALDGPSALAAWGVLPPSRDKAIDVVIPASRRVDDPAGVSTRRSRAWERIVQMHLGPPRVRLETAALTVAAHAGSDDQAVALLGDIVQRRRTTAERLHAELQDQSRVPRRGLLSEVRADLSSGALSALERRYLRDVERAHRLPRGLRQVRVTNHGGVSVQDVVYRSQRLVVELDGRLGHELWASRWHDLDRDLRSLRDGSATLRVGWGQVLHPCRLADGISATLVARGWPGRPRRCGPDCLLT